FISFFFASRRRHTRSKRDWSSDVCSSDLEIEDSINLNIIINTVTAVLMMIMTPPIVGVPVFCIWDLGPSVRILWPNFNRLKNGIKIGLKRTVIKKMIAIVIMTTYRFIDFSSFHTVQHYLQASTNCSNCIIRDALNNMTVLLLRCFCNLFSNCNLVEKCATDMCCSSFFNILVISSALCPYV